VRSPGSTLKPLIYGLAFDAGLAHPETLIDDRPTRFGTYVPKNFDHDWHGTITVREALAKSLNIPAVKALEGIGPQKLHGSLMSLGIAPQLPKHAEPSLAMALGGVGMTASDLATLYATIARGGEAVSLTYRRDQSRTTPSARLMSPVAAFYLRDVLKNAPPPANARTGQIAYKTGTSYGYRDAWSAGFDGRHTVVAWVGRADGAPVSGLNGRQSAAPLLFDAFHRIGERRTPFPVPPAGVLRVAGIDLPPTLKRFNDMRSDDVVAGFREQPVAIVFPPDRAEIEAAPSDGDAIIIKAEGGRLPLTWFVDGAPMASEPDRREVALDALGRGFVKLSVTDAAGRTDRVTVRLK
jgi:penicillin-binding protein 1C